MGLVGWRGREALVQFGVLPWGRMARRCGGRRVKASHSIESRICGAPPSVRTCGARWKLDWFSCPAGLEQQLRLPVGLVGPVQLDAAVGAAAGGRGVIRHRVALAVSLGRDPPGVHALVDQLLAHRVGARLGRRRKGAKRRRRPRRTDCSSVREQGAEQLRTPVGIDSRLDGRLDTLGIGLGLVATAEPREEGTPRQIDHPLPGTALADLGEGTQEHGSQPHFLPLLHLLHRVAQGVRPDTRAQVRRLRAGHRGRPGYSYRVFLSSLTSFLASRILSL